MEEKLNDLAEQYSFLLSQNTQESKEKAQKISQEFDRINVDLKCMECNKKATIECQFH